MIELNKIYQEPCLTTIERFEDNSIDCIITSPPYWQLRDYGYPEQWGLEPTFQEYLGHLWEMIEALIPKLKHTGTIWINLGDTYGTKSGGMANSGDYSSKESKHAGLGAKVNQPQSIHKSLLLLPHRFAIGCMDRGLIVRNDIVWAKRNAMPESVTDRFSKKHEYFFFMTKSTDYYFDLDSVRVKSAPLNRWGGNKLVANGVSTWDMNTGQNSYRTRDMQPNNGMKNPGTVSDFWDIPTKPSKESHFATYNDELIKKPIIAGCPKGGLIYDPFMGSGNTAIMALRTERNYVGSEPNEDYCKIAERKINPHKIQTNLFS